MHRLKKCKINISNGKIGRARGTYTKVTAIDIYADDTTVHASDKDQEIVETNVLTGASTKTECMLLGSRQKVMQVDKFEISLDNAVIKMAELQRLLCVLIDNILHWISK